MMIPYDHHNYPPQDLEGVKAYSGDTRGGQKNMGLTGPLKEGLLGYTRPFMSLEGLGQKNIIPAVLGGGGEKPGKQVLLL